MLSESQHKKIVLFSSDLNLDDRSCQWLTLASSPSACLKKAMENGYELIAILHKSKLLKEREALVEFCAMLKKNHQTLHIPILFLLPGRHRKMLEHLNAVGVDFVRFYGSTDSVSIDELENLLEVPTEACRIERILPEICPYINYFPISRHQEILYCGAYRNRLVLGGYRLSHSCETMNHQKCQYFKCPKL